MGLFGPSIKMRQTPGINQISDQLLNYNSKLGKAGKFANKRLASINQGRIDELPELAAIRNFGAARKQQADIAGATGANALMAGNQPILSRRLSQLEKDRVDQDTGMQISAAIPGIQASAMAASQQALSDWRNFDINRIAQAGNLLNAGTQWFQQPGILTSIAGGALGAATGIKGLFR